MIRQGFADVEAAVRKHPRRAIEIYETGTSAFRRGQEDVTDLPAHLHESGLTLSEAKLVFSNLSAMAFMSWWYQQHGLMEDRNKTANNAAILVGGTGMDAEYASKTLLEHEHNWRIAFQSSIGNEKQSGCLTMLLIVYTLVLTLVFQT